MSFCTYVLCLHMHLSAAIRGGGVTLGYTRAWCGIYQLCSIILSPGWGEWIAFARRSKQDPRGKTRGIC